MISIKRHSWVDWLGKAMALTGALGLLGMAASLSTATALAGSPGGYSLSTQAYTASGLPSAGGNTGAASSKAAPGDYIYDTATVSSGSYVQSGSIEFELFQGNPYTGCYDLGTPLLQTSVPVSSTEGEGLAGRSESVSGLSAGADGYYQIPADASNGSQYFWVATYSAAGGTSVSSPCGSEPVSVQVVLPQLSVTTQATPTTAAAPFTAADTATVSNWPQLLADDPEATASVVFELFSGTSCQGQPVAPKVPGKAIPLGSAGTAQSPSGAYTITRPGAYEWLAQVSVNVGAGWPQIQPFESACGSEPLDSQATTSVSTWSSASPAEVGTVAQFGSQLADSATVEGGLNPSGTVTFELFDNASCSGTPVYSDSVSLSSGRAQSGTYVANQAGTWEWEAQYSGDDFNTAASSGCGQEPLTVERATPQVTTVTSSGSQQVPVGSGISDSTEVSNQGTPSGASGDVYFNLFAPDQPSCSGEPVFIDEQALTVGPDYSYATSAQFTVDHLGTYSWTVAYDGDANNNPSSSPCGSELVDVVQATPQITTTTQSQVVVGSQVSDEAEITGGFRPDSDASVTFGLYSDASCTQLVGQTSTGAVNAQGDAFSAPVTVSWPGLYYWEDTYSGNDLNQTVTSNCQSEPVLVTKKCPTVSTVQQTPVTTAPVTTVSDTATLSGLYPAPQGQSNGQVHFELFGPVAGSSPQCPCQGSDLVAQGWVPVTEVNGQFQATFTDQIQHPLLPGNYYWEADYSGDAYNRPASSGCGELTVVLPNTPAVSTAPSSGGTIGTVITDTATVTPVVSPNPASGTASQPTAVADGTPDSVHFQLFLNDPTCAASGLVANLGSFTQSETSNPDGSITYTVSLPASGYKTVSSGTYYWDVTFTGDDYNTTVSSCGEPVSITTPVGHVLGVSTPNTGSDLFGTGLLGSLVLFLGGLLLLAGRRALRPRTR